MPLLIIIRLFFAFDLPLVGAHEIYPEAHILPLGGSELAQVGILLTVAFFVTELIQIFRDWKKRDE